MIKGFREEFFSLFKHSRIEIMKNTHLNRKTAKISEEFQVLLDHLEPQHKVRVIVVLRNGDTKITPGRRQPPAERQAAIEAVRKSAEPALVEIDEVPEAFRRETHGAERQRVRGDTCRDDS